MKLTMNNIVILAMTLFTLILPFWKGTNGNYGSVWEDASVFATVCYAVIIYTVGFFGGKFTNLNDSFKGLIGIIVLVIIVLSLPFILGFLKLWFAEVGDLYSKVNLARTYKMLILVGIALLFFVVDLIMLKKADTDKINYATNLYQSDIPVLIGLIVLCLYAFHIGDQVIEDQNIDHFFEGAIAFQMIFSNIIWMYNDDGLWGGNSQAILTGGK